MASSHIEGVSCVIPTHRRGPYLSEAILSVLDQTLPVLEVIVVSDLRDDEARARCASIATDDPRVRYLERDDGQPGASGSRNTGARVAVGTMIAFLDDDDLWAPTFLEQLVETMDDGIELAASWITEFSEQQEKDGHSLVPGLLGADVVARNPGVTGSNFVVATPAFLALGGFDPNLRVRNDTDFFARYLRSGRRYAVVPERLMLQRKHSLGQLTAVDESRALGTERYIDKHREHLSRRDLRELRQLVHRIRSRCAPSRAARIYHLGWVAALYGPIGLARKLRAGRQHATFEIRSLDVPH